MNVKTICVGGLVVFVVLSLVDLIQTWLLIKEGGGRIYEGNPVAGAWLADYGWRGLVTFKAAAMLILVSVIVLLSRRRPQTAAAVVVFACLAVGSVSLYGRHLLHNPPPPPEETDADEALARPPAPRGASPRRRPRGIPVRLRGERPRLSWGPFPSARAEAPARIVRSAPSLFLNGTSMKGRD